MSSLEVFSVLSLIIASCQSLHIISNMANHVNMKVELNVGRDLTTATLRCEIPDVWFGIAFNHTSHSPSTMAVIYNANGLSQLNDALLSDTYTQPSLLPSEWTLVNALQHGESTTITITRPNKINTNTNYPDFDICGQYDALDAIWAHGNSVNFIDHGPYNRIHGKLRQLGADTPLPTPFPTNRPQNALPVDLNYTLHCDPLATCNSLSSSKRCCQENTQCLWQNTNACAYDPSSTSNCCISAPIPSTPSPSITCPDSIEVIDCHYEHEECCIADRECRWKLTGTPGCVLNTPQPTVHIPTVDPTVNPTIKPTSQPTMDPTLNPSLSPTLRPSLRPTFDPTINPTVRPTQRPSIRPTTDPTYKPTEDPTTATPSVYPTAEPTKKPVCMDFPIDSQDDINDCYQYPPHCCPVSSGECAYDEEEEECYPVTDMPSSDPTDVPTDEPTDEPTDAPTDEPTDEPTNEPTVSPSAEPTISPSSEPTSGPTNKPTMKPTNRPTDKPTEKPSREPTDEPTISPSDRPTHSPTYGPSDSPIISPTTDEPTLNPVDIESFEEGFGGEIEPCQCDTGITRLNLRYIGTRIAKRIILYGYPTQSYGRKRNICKFKSVTNGQELVCDIVTCKGGRYYTNRIFPDTTYFMIRYGQNYDGSSSNSDSGELVLPSQCSGAIDTACNRDIVTDIDRNCGDLMVIGWTDIERENECDETSSANIDGNLDDNAFIGTSEEGNDELVVKGLMVAAVIFSIAGIVFCVKCLRKCDKVYYKRRKSDPFEQTSMVRECQNRERGSTIELSKSESSSTRDDELDIHETAPERTMDVTPQQTLDVNTKGMADSYDEFEIDIQTTAGHGPIFPIPEVPESPDNMNESPVHDLNNGVTLDVNTKDVSYESSVPSQPGRYRSSPMKMKQLKSIKQVGLPTPNIRSPVDDVRSPMNRQIRGATITLSKTLSRSQGSSVIFDEGGFEIDGVPMDHLPIDELEPTDTTTTQEGNSDDTDIVLNLMAGSYMRGSYSVHNYLR